ncbi:MAG: hypothetical protein FJ276_03860 [Planctomycetes bacterium]|nr:hypothetical protein [Planctomycetota bacterium]
MPHICQGDARSFWRVMFDCAHVIHEEDESTPSTSAGQVVSRTEFDAADIRQSIPSPGRVRGVVSGTLNE